MLATITTPVSPGPSTSPSGLHRIPSSSKLNRLVTPATSLQIPNNLHIPDVPVDEDGHSAPVPFPRLSQRRKLYRGVGTQPWHHRAADSDEEDNLFTPPPARSTSQSSHQASVSSSGSSSISGSSSGSAATGAGAGSGSGSGSVIGWGKPQFPANADPRRTYSESQISTPNPATFSVYGTPLVRKKSGEVVKSALRSPCSSTTSIAGRLTVRPITPTLEKFVHFDGQLEHVRLFHKEQRPTAVSREGSPQDTETSDQDDATVQSDGHYATSDEERLRANLAIDTVNIPLRNAMATTSERLGDLDVRLDQVSLSKDGHTVEGTIFVRNIAFEKWVAVRFTFDWWQTTSEVTARYSKSFPEDNIDLFSFSIRLPDVNRRIEEKRLLFALRYKAGGVEAWDNNRGDNYQLRFKIQTKSDKANVQSKDASSSSASAATAAGPQSKSKPSSHPPSWPVKSANVDQMADLRRELERVVREDDESNGVRSWDILTAKLRARNMNLEEERDSKVDALNLKNRYDFKQSSKVKWEAPKEIPKFSGPSLDTAIAIPFPSLPIPQPKSQAQPQTQARPNYLSRFPSNQSNESSFGSSWRSPRGSPRDYGTGSTPGSPKFFIDPKDARHWRDPHSPHGHHEHHQHQQQYNANTNANAYANTSGQFSPTGARARLHQRGGYFDSWMESTKNAVPVPVAPSISPSNSVESGESAENTGLSASESADSVDTVTQGTTGISGATGASQTTLETLALPAPTRNFKVTIIEDTSSETESSDSTVSSQTYQARLAEEAIGMGIEQSRAMRFNSYPMDRSYLSPPMTTPTGSLVASPSAVVPPATSASNSNSTSTNPANSTNSGPAPPNGLTHLTVPAPSWPLSPQGSSSSITSTPSFTSASSPSNAPSSPSEFSEVPSLDQLTAEGRRLSLDSLDYSYFLRRFCYYTGAEPMDRQGSNANVYGSGALHRHSRSDGHWDATPVMDVPTRRYNSLESAPIGLSAPSEAIIQEVSVEGDDNYTSGHTTPTPSPRMKNDRFMDPISSMSSLSSLSSSPSPSPGKQTPRPRSPSVQVVEVESTGPDFELGRPSAPFVRPYRGSL